MTEAEGCPVGSKLGAEAFSPGEHSGVCSGFPTAV